MSDLASYTNRLAKNAKHWGKWARRHGVNCYRLYDRDVPQFPVIVDWYAGRVHLQEYDTGWVQTDEAHEAWLAEIWEATAQTLGVSEDLVSVKTRRRQEGSAQYERTGHEGEDFVVEENGLKFIVNLDSHLDSGLFLDHRNTRARVRTEAAGKRFLNLFCYTGAFTVYAAAGGARETMSVDLSNTYLDWAARNLALNGFAEGLHRRVRQDVFQFLTDAIDDGAQYELIVMDPPSFSNSKKMQGVLDVQKDHRWLVEACLEILSPNGTLYFSNNLRTFKLDPALLPLCEDLSAASVPEDFRNQRIHQCFRFAKASDGHAGG
ncbi:class I SAM-dependent methyltransferase [Chitiniphilus purpureus]|uniref:Class I SAM-dependent methyltransferase n=1 Tax=Chitiniphilus purpureus TaxID=2981137 RepID=A0ABY6DPX6_9NEIS|nr:class I SAM-dependent methyltransferase [Chitiniphilus sp. CD1]UXY16278.1 class I SAM-dependent methyltransferase [Chitiniphilus sp. CD1]